MLASFLKFVAFTLAPALMMIWTTSPDLWSHVSHSFHHVGSNPSRFVHMFEDLPGRDQDILVTSENIVRSLICDDLEFYALKPVPSIFPMPLPSEAPVTQVQEKGLGIQEPVPKRSLWLLSSMILMGLDSYFLQLSAISSLWTPLQVTIPVFHWMVSWWIIPPGWEPNLVILVPLSHNPGAGTFPALVVAVGLKIYA
ncbi:hypothetical protein DSO57_1018214 [Entomophthora muscae]|uniref:Uncharacterized protein n=1 Tax=Entomophthora muscae TaxID=34485 RepID=A0ACC2RVN9_9FUNG|nr:hypothetical protein DSO57_1018214 [Entomophthora muscae]